MSSAVIFDLDDTLYKEINYLKSGLKSVSKVISKDIDETQAKIFEKLYFYYKNSDNPFKKIINEYNLSYSLGDLILLYKNHKPKIKLSEETKETLHYLIKNNYELGLITDGSSNQQREKISALKIDSYITEYVISDEVGSEKPNKNNYKYFSEKKFSYCKKFYYIADNLSKDFIAPNDLGWITICILDNGENIHKQKFSINNKFLPQHSVKSIKHIIPIINEK